MLTQLHGVPRQLHGSAMASRGTVPRKCANSTYGR